MKIRFLEIAVFFFLVLFIFVLSNASVQAANPLDVVINEIAWMGTQTAHQDEWIELYNNTSSLISLEGWQLVAQDGVPEIILARTIPANGYYLLERTDNTTVPNIAADKIYIGNLGNNGEYLKIFDAQDDLIDGINYSKGWPAGDNSTKQTMERVNSNLTGTIPTNWQTSQNSGGTPKAENSTIESEPEPEPVCEPTEEICDGIDNDCDGEIDEDGICETPEPPTSQPEPIIYPSGIFINEFLPSPEGPDLDEEWIEIYNNNPTSIDFSGWTIEDTQGSIKIYTLPQGINIQGYGFLVLNRPTSKIVLNNDGEGLILKDPLGKLVNSVNYNDKAPEGQSYARKTNGIWQWTSVLTPEQENRFAIPAEANLEAEAEPEPQSSSDKSSTDKSEDRPKPQPKLEAEASSVPQNGTSKDKPRFELTTYPSGIVINEILPSPDGPDKDNEWIEIFNQNNFEVNLSDWQIQDMKGKTRTYTFSQETKIIPRGFLILPRPTTKITLNNDGDGLNLVQPNDNIVDQVIYDKAPLNSSYSRTHSGWAWSNILTPGSENTVPAKTSQGAKENESSYSKISDKELAAVGKQLPKASRSLFILLVAVVIAIFSGATVLVLKNKIKLN
ncbi:MAG TPA: hypothetical protein ENI19_00925 [Candidatus Nealsonbacteria bacterium]|nr:hypothetical protein [Candidatus Nealsonbacteria bacterium]HEB46255.1 hypothetical protein [Candidatus Nealsonbacteria bacterium]